MDDNSHSKTDGYETTDANIRGILIFLCVLAMVAVAVHGVVIGAYKTFKAGASRRDEEIMRQAVVPSVAGSRTNFPQPREEISSQLDLKALREREAAELNSYGWIDRTTGVVRIPISRAMELVSERGMAETNPVGPSSLQLQQERVGKEGGK